MTTYLTTSNKITSAELQKIIQRVVAELRTWSGARAIAAAEGIEAGLTTTAFDWDCKLWKYCEQRIGESALQQGYIYSDDDGFDGEWLLGYGPCTDLLAEYCDLRKHFGAGWLEKTLMAGASTIGEASALLEKAQRSFEEACARMGAQRVAA